MKNATTHLNDSLRIEQMGYSPKGKRTQRIKWALFNSSLGVVRMDQSFTPHHLKNVEPLESYSIISHGYWRVAQHLHSLSKDENPPKGIGAWQFVFPAIIIYQSCLEAYFQETLTHSRKMRENRGAPEDLEEIKKINLLRYSKRPYSDYNLWLREMFLFYDKSKHGIDANSKEYQNCLALKELRNAIAHYTPTFREYNKWPKRIQQAFMKAKPKPMNSSWVSALSQIEIVDWASKTVRDAVVLFCSKSGAICPFTSDSKRHPSYKWDIPSE